MVAEYDGEHIHVIQTKILTLPPQPSDFGPNNFIREKWVFPKFWPPPPLPFLPKNVVLYGKCFFPIFNLSSPTFRNFSPPPRLHVWVSTHYWYWRNVSVGWTVGHAIHVIGLHPPPPILIGKFQKSNSALGIVFIIIWPPPFLDANVSLQFSGVISKYWRFSKFCPIPSKIAKVLSQL